MARILRYHHVTHNISRSNLAAARHFYGELLGLKEIPPMGDPTNQQLIWFAVAEQQLHLVMHDRAETETTRHLALLVQDFENLVASLAASRVRLDCFAGGRNWGIRPDGSKYTFCYDPDANRIELMEAR